MRSNAAVVRGSLWIGDLRVWKRGVRILKKVINCMGINTLWQAGRPGNKHAVLRVVVLAPVAPAIPIIPNDDSEAYHQRQLSSNPRQLPCPDRVNAKAIKEISDIGVKLKGTLFINISSTISSSMCYSLSKFRTPDIHPLQNVRFLPFKSLSGHYRTGVIGNQEK